MKNETFLCFTTYKRFHDNRIRPDSTSANDCQPSESCINRKFFLFPKVSKTCQQFCLIRAGIEQNPSPIWFCSVCHKTIRTNTTSVRCNECGKWCHHKRCSSLNDHRECSDNYRGNCCNTQSEAALTNNRRNDSPTINNNRTWNCSIGRGMTGAT